MASSTPELFLKSQPSNFKSPLSTPWKNQPQPFPSLGKDREQRSAVSNQRSAVRAEKSQSQAAGCETRDPGRGISFVELLAPAGDRDAALAALYYGADALYCGLERFSARAEATNFSAEQLGELVAYAHSLTPRRRVFVTVNTVVLERERAALIETLDVLDQLGVDAIIVQDLGVLRLARRCFPRLTLHASTQLAIHNIAGVEVLRDLGVRRVTLARELTLDEIRDISASCGIETEVFIHGALCYCYSGLCLYSSQLRGRSGNRGRCAYPCREMFAVNHQPSAINPSSSGFAFSMKDLALPDRVAELRAAGVASFKIEGRKKTALYVGATVDYYRRQIDGALTANEAVARQEDLRTIFARPWTSLYVGGRSQRNVVDSEIVGHRGAMIGRVETVIAHGGGSARLRFKTARTLERHDGIQVDIPGGKPFGFPIDMLRLGGKNVISAPTGSAVEVELPHSHPQLPVGAALYCSSSQAVKRSFPFQRPKPGAYKIRQKISITCTLAPDKISAQTNGGVVAELNGAFQPTKDAVRMEAAARGAFEKLGDTNFELASFTLENPQGLFTPVSLLNELRRKLCAELTAALATQTAERLTRLRSEAEADMPPLVKTVTEECWLLKVDRPTYLDAFESDDWRDVEEICVAAEVEPLPQLLEGLAKLGGVIGREKIRLALPVITRRWEEQDLIERIHALRAAGWQKWEAANISAWALLRKKEMLDLAADWPLYALNTSAAAQLFAMGARHVTLSPEDGLDNMRELLKKLGERAVVVVYQDTPLYIAETCPVASLNGECSGPSRCPFKELEMVSNAGEHVIAINRRCRTYTINRHPFCLAGRLAALRAAGARRLRADFILHPYTAVDVTRIWRDLRAGRAGPGTHLGNFDRGLL